MLIIYTVNKLVYCKGGKVISHALEFFFFPEQMDISQEIRNLLGKQYFSCIEYTKFKFPQVHTNKMAKKEH
jgi:hypothetical protein